jgi:hypothetical protein
MLLLALRRVISGAAIAAALAATSLQAQPSFGNVIVKDEGFAEQTSSTGPSAIARADFETDVYGYNVFTVNGTPTVTVGGGHHSGATDSLSSNGFMYSYSDDTSTVSHSEYTLIGGSAGVFADYGAGNYTVSIPTTTGTKSVTLSFPAIGTISYPNIPSVSLGGGAWSTSGPTNGKYVIGAGSNLSISSNTFSADFYSGASAIILQGFDEDTHAIVLIDQTLTSGLSTTSLADTINAASLTAGDTYQFSLEFSTSVSSAGNGIAPDTSLGVDALAAISRDTEFEVTVSAVPEPSDFVLWAGIAGLVGLATFRLYRRRTAA